MGKRKHLLLVVVASLLVGAFGSLVVVAATTKTADACSIAGPHAEVWPSHDLKAGQQIELAGSGFFDIRLHERPAEQDTSHVPELCDFDLYPIEGIEVIWRGGITERLGVVAGPDFKLLAIVPAAAAAGPASISIGPVTLRVQVGPTVQPPPPPCSLAVQPDRIAGHQCPEPCPQYGAASRSTTQPAPGVDDAPGFTPHCPEPCIGYAHTIDDGTAADYRWDCPEPCQYGEVNPGVAPQEALVWCPPPEPCPVYLAAGQPELVRCPDPCGLTGTTGVWCPPPEPCPVYLAAGQPELVRCPDPCGLTGTTGVWCPPPEPCPYVAVDSGGASQGGLVWCPPPEPCPYVTVEPGAVSQDALTWCPPPEPCPVHLAAGQPELVPCPDPCDLVTVEAVWCPPPYPCPTSFATDTPQTATAKCAIPCPYDSINADLTGCSTTTRLATASDEPAPGSAVEVAAAELKPASATGAVGTSATNAVVAMSQQVIRLAQAMVAALFG